MRRFIISRVIPLGFGTEPLMMKMVQQPFSSYKSDFPTTTPYKYRVPIHQSTKQFPVVNFSNKYQEELYRQSFGKLEQLNNLDETLNALSLLDAELEQILHHSQMNVTGSNFVSFDINVDKKEESQIEEAVRKYQQLVDNLKGNELWLNKVKEELGKYVHILYMGLEEGKKEKLFTNFNKHEYFV